MSKAVVTFALLAAAAAGAYGWIAHSRYTADEDLLARERSDRTRLTEDLAASQRARDTDKSEADRNLKASQGELDALPAERAEAAKRLEAGRRENRRIEIVLLPNLSEIPDVPAGLAGNPAATTPPVATAPPAPSAAAPASSSR